MRDERTSFTTIDMSGEWIGRWESGWIIGEMGSYVGKWVSVWNLDELFG